MSRKESGFTLTEILMVVICVAILTAFAIPNYLKTFEKADERSMIANLKSMRTAMDMFLNNGGTIGSWGSLGAVNTNLGLSIAHPSITYTCGTAGDGTNGCTAAHPEGWELEFNDDALPNSRLIHCTDASCPTCPAAAGNCE